MFGKIGLLVPTFKEPLKEPISKSLTKKYLSKISYSEFVLTFVS